MVVRQPVGGAAQNTMRRSELKLTVEPSGISPRPADFEEALNEPGVDGTGREEARPNALACARLGFWRCNQRERTWQADAVVLAWYGIPATEEMFSLDELFSRLAPDVGTELKAVLAGPRDAGEVFVKELHLTSGPSAGCWHRWEGQADVTESWLVTGSCLDITEQARALQALRESEERFRALITASSDVVYRMSPDWREMRFLAGHDFIPDTLQPTRTWLDRYIHPEDQAHVWNVIEEAIATKSQFELEHRVLRVDGSSGWTFSRAAPILDANGEIVEWLGMAKDVSARKRAELESAADLDALRRIHALSATGVQSSTIQPLLQEILEAAVYIVHADKALLQLIEQDELILVAQQGHEPAFLEFCARAGMEAFVTAEALRRGERVIAENVEQLTQTADARTREALRAAAVGALQSTPLLTRSGRRLGVLTTHWTESPTLTKRELWRLALLARQAADLIEQASTEAALRETDAQLRRALHAMTCLQQLGMRSLRCEDLHSVLDAVVETAVAVTGADFGNIQLLDEASGRLRIVAQRGFPEWWLEFWDGAPAGQSACGEALAVAQRVVVEDVEQSPIFIGTPGLEIQRRAGVHAVQSTPLFSRTGKVVGVLSTHYKAPCRPAEQVLQILDLLALQAADIIEHQQMEAALRQSEERFRVALKGSPATVYSLDRELRYTWIYNPIAGFVVEELLGKRVEDAWNARWRAEDVQTLTVIKQRALAEGTARRDEVVVHRADTSGELVLDITTEPLRESDGTITGVTCVAVDITEQRRAQDLLRAKRFGEHLIDAANVAIMGLDERGCTAVFNRAAEKISGYSRTDLAGRNWFEVLVPRDRFSDVWVELAQSPENRMPDTFETPILTKNGEQRTMSWRNSAINVENDRVITISFGIDLTDQRRAEQYLVNAQKMESIGTLAGGIAHDFNNILNGILGGIALFELSQHETSEYLTGIDDMKALVRRGADLCKQLLGFACRGKYLPKPLDIARIVEEISTTFGRTRPDITILHEFAEALPPVFMDQAQLEQTLLNLFLNAARAMPAGGRLLLHAEEATTSDEEAKVPGIIPGHFVRLVVADTGVGMDSATKARVFEPFFTTRHGDGVGLGMASAYGIVKNHGGSIAVESEPGKGSAFTLMLPVAEARPHVATIPASARAQKDCGLILIVDDELRLLSLWDRALRKLGYEVLTASSGPRALELAQIHAKELKLVILDLVMPGMGGAETFDALRNIAPELKVLLVSGRSDDGEVQALLSRGCSGFIGKPFDVATLAAKLQSLI